MPKRIVLCGLLAVLLAAPLSFAADRKVPFSATLTSEQKAALGLAAATPEQLAALDAAVAAYGAKQEAVAAREAATAAVAEYREKQEPKVVAAALASTEPPAKAEGPERFTATIVGRFEGWTGSTVFTLDNGQVWKQASQDRYYPKARNDAAVAIYKSPSGHWRLRVLDDEGAWVTVKRLK